MRPNNNISTSIINNKWSKNFDERPHRPSTCHPRGGWVQHFGHDALSRADKSAAPVRLLRRLLRTQSNAFQGGQTPKITLFT